MCHFNSCRLLYPILLTISLFGNDEHPRELIDDAHCMRCHSVSDFEAREEKINSFKKLRHQTKACAENNFAGWFDEDVQSVSEYLNLRYYKFNKEEPQP